MKDMMKESASKFDFGCAERLWLRLVIAATMAAPFAAPGQGTVVFSGQIGLYGTNYFESDVWFRVIVPTPGTGSPDYDSMVKAPIPTPANIPYSTTPYLAFFRQFSPDDFVSFSLTNSNAFGLSSVDLADPVSPSLSPVPIMFKGYKTDGSSVTNTFTTPGGGATTFLNYTFTSAFADGLTGVDILASRWAMDNLVVTIPEPSAAALLFAGGGLWFYARFRKKD